MHQPTDLSMEAASALALGARSRQEDALAVSFPEGAEIGFSVLSDGMGGHSAGDIASRIIVSEMFAELTLSFGEGEFGAESIPTLLRNAVHIANRCIATHTREHPDCRGMGGTLVSTVVVGGNLYWASVGDSPLYLFRAGKLKRLNADHSMAPQIDLMVAEGLMDAETGRHHPQRSCLTSALIGEGIGEVDCPDEPLQLEEGDIVVAASDGLQFISDQQIQRILLRTRKDSSRGVARSLLESIAEADEPDQDNVSIIILKVATEVQQPFASVRSVPAAMFRSWRSAVAPLRNRVVGN